MKSTFDDDLKDLRHRFRSETKALRGRIPAPAMTTNYSHVGEAFDWLLRFYVKKLNPFAKISWWRPEFFINCYTKHREWEKEHMPNSRMYLQAYRFYACARLSYSHYLSSGRVTDQLLRAVLRLPILDLGHFRFEVEETDMMDLMNLIDLVKPGMFKAKTLAVLPPFPGPPLGFGRVFGADLLIDGDLIDIKTTMKLHLKEDYLKQLFLNYIILARNGIRGLGIKPDISRCGIYYSRYGFLFLIDVPELVRLYGNLVERYESRKSADSKSLIANNFEGQYRILPVSYE